MKYFEAVLLAFTLSLDALTAAFAYGTSKIKIPWKSMLIIDVLCTLTLILTFYLGTVIQPYISQEAIRYIAFALMLLIGLVKLFEELIKWILRKKTKDELEFKMFGFRFLLRIYQNETTADADKNKILTAAEAVSLAVALSFDSLAVGFSAGIAQISAVTLFISTLLFGYLALLLGVLIGGRIARRSKLNLSWLSGAILIVLAVIRLF